MSNPVVQAVAALLLLVTIAAAVLAIWSIILRPAEGQRPSGGARLERGEVTGTTGVFDEGLSLGVLDSWVADVYTLGGSGDLSGQVRKAVVVVAESSRAVNDVAFWIGTRPYGVLVVADRDVRSGLQRALGSAADSPLGHLPAGLTTFAGTVEPVPPPEAAYSWALTRREVEALAERGAYVRLHDVLSTAPGRPDTASAGAIEEFGRETAPPPGDQVDTIVPPPPP